MRALLRALLLTALLATAGSAVLAQAARSSPDAGNLGWNALSAQQRQVLAPLQPDWTQMDPARRAKWLEVANRFPAMPAAERQRVQERMADWARMTPNERGRARLNFQEAKQLSPEERQERWEAYQALPDERRKALADRAKPAETARKPGDAAQPLASSVPKKPPEAPRTAASGPLVKPVAPTIVQAKPGATTTLMTHPPAPPAHQQPGQPRIAAKPEQVNRTTLLPRSGPQATAAASAPVQP